MEGSLRAPFIIRWPGQVPADRTSKEIVHEVDTFTTFARLAGAELPKDRIIDGVDQSDFLLGKQDKSNREGFPCYVAEFVACGEIAALEGPLRLARVPVRPAAALAESADG